MNRRMFLRHLGTWSVAPGVISLSGRPTAVHAQTRAELRRLPQGQEVPALLTPQPQQATFGESFAVIDSSWGIRLAGPTDIRSTVAAERLARHLIALGGPSLAHQDLRSGEDGRRCITLVNFGGASPASAIAVLLGGEGTAGRIAEALAAHESNLPSRLGGPVVRRHEAYHLVIEPDRVVLAAHGVEGLLYGHQTLMQLLTVGALELPGRLRIGTVFDWPAAALRGYLADVRQPPYRFVGSALDGWKQHIDRLAAAKCNYIALDHSYTFQYALPGEPVGLSGGLGVQTSRSISDYAALHGIMVIPVVELSHGDSLRSFMAKNAGRYSWMRDHQNGGFCPFNEASYAFIDRMLAELVTCFPYTPYLHVGEDETSTIYGSDTCPRCRQAVGRYASESGRPPDPIGYPMAYFQTRVSEMAVRHQRQTMVWGTFGFLDDSGIRPIVPRVMTKDVIIWDWMERGFAKAGYQTWPQYLPSWEWKGPGVREFVTHMVAFMTKPVWDGRPNRTAAGSEIFARAWALTTFGLDEPDIGRRCLWIFGHDPYGWSWGDDSSRSRWLRLRFGHYLCLKPDDFKEAKNRHAPQATLDADIKRFEADCSLFEEASSRARLNRSLLEWYGRGSRLSLFGLQYVQSLQRAHLAIRDAASDMPEPQRRQLFELAQDELNSILARASGPIAAIVRLSDAELGGPVLDSPIYPLLDYDLTGARNGVAKGVQALVKHVTGLAAGRAAPPPASLGLFPTVGGG